MFQVDYEATVIIQNDWECWVSNKIIDDKRFFECNPKVHLEIYGNTVMQ